MSLQQKLFRKFFYENSGFMDSEVRFLEITNERVGARVGLSGLDKVMLVQNKNLFGKLQGAEDF
jgi:hypothetical protein